ncbi:methylated-DNA--[protein]-cysteine S-methyltransferase [Dyadobacter tibetensis]|uniref:methylated-DNA--[protein]-cysteine S-methyltransferase n=1 Tax=Dyadobacter tibetensis TaxID=1211851 RepID=UPI00046FD114|nr:methylated-DNA--[protein]-cysteine S-methyltransferase [Dyadobacter tibetensis]
MKHQDHINYDRIARAITFIHTQFREQPTLEQIADAVHLSPYHFQRLFTEWAGISPKKFLQYISVNYAKSVLNHPRATLFDAAEATGLSGTSRLHDLFIGIEGMTPGEYKMGGESLEISYGLLPSPFGNLFAASTDKGICQLNFVQTREEGLQTLLGNFPKAKIQQAEAHAFDSILPFFDYNHSNLPGVKLHLKGSPFQLKVWQALLQIPAGGLSTYGNIAGQIQQPTASRAVGTAIGSNPIAFLIPCHRVIQASGAIGGYRWDPVRKKAMIGWEAARSIGILAEQ